MGGMVGKEVTQREKQGRADDFPNQRICQDAAEKRVLPSAQHLQLFY